jgi:hypothetical protein
MRIENAMTRAPTIVSFAYAPASLVQKTSGAKSSQMPLKQSPQRARSNRGESVSRPQITTTTPVAISLTTMATSR